MNIVIFGDSITWGAVDSENGGWSNQLRNYFEAQQNDVEVYNCGIPGDTTTNLILRVESEAKTREAEMIIFAIGINDAKFIHSSNATRTSLDTYKSNLSKLTSIASAFTKNIMFIGLTAVDETKTHPLLSDEDQSWTNNDIQSFNGALKEFCAEQSLNYISMEGVIGNEDLFDGLHPNTQGHKKIFNIIKPVIESFLSNNQR